MKAHQLEELLIKALVRRAGSTQRRWRIVLGPIRVYDPETHPHCNWHVSPSGNSAENDVVETLLDEIRGSHPRIEAG